MRLFVVDDHPVTRAGMAALIGAEPDMTLVGEAATAADAVAGVADTAPDVVLMDLQLGDGPDGVEATRRLRALPDPPYVLVLTTYDTDSDIVRAIDAGAIGYILKAGPPDELFAAIRAAAEGHSALSPQVATKMMNRMREPLPSLTNREIDILRLLAAGSGNRDIAKQLYITEATVKTHLVHIFRKLNVDSRTAAVREAVRRKLIRMS
ncbi:MAG TPA: response regulator transcription factor [Stackebrandtia sp.]|uniref:response regulator transcription factor n=1 Tax=Stackebrandtia sp. TaxID=2023065 RepID=UPI002D5D513C|nr:response regulator transcription factor [Stackebrandtia sp.]HZE41014.1 response regulator transcription factor [Stackebrandtia sp.]